MGSVFSAVSEVGSTSSLKSASSSVAVSSNASVSVSAIESGAANASTVAVFGLSSPPSTSKLVSGSISLSSSSLRTNLGKTLGKSTPVTKMASGSASLSDSPLRTNIGATDAKSTPAPPTNTMTSSPIPTSNVQAAASPSSPLSRPAQATSSTVHSTSLTSAESSGSAKTQASPQASSPAHSTSSTAVVGESKASPMNTITSTITDAPESTLAQPSFIPVVSNGKTSLSAPPLVTILSTSTEGNGSFVTFTHIVANPGPTGGFSQAISGGRTSFFDNTGAVAGVFLVVGAILTSVVAFGLFVLCRQKRRRQERHRRWLISVNRPRPLSDGDPFTDPFTSPPMRSFDRPWDGRVPSLQQNNSAGIGLYNVTPPRRIDSPEEHGAAYHSGGNVRPNEIGLAVTTNETALARQPSAQSSPSIYPASLPPADEDRVFEDARPQLQPRASSDISAAPPRPRRSHLRDPPHNAHLITPPSSDTSHSPVSEFAGPNGFNHADVDPSTLQKPSGGLRLNEIMGRRTLLDVRPRSQDSSDWKRL